MIARSMGYDALGTGWLMVALAVGTFFISGLTPRLTERLGQRSVVRIGLALEAFAVAGIAIALPTDTWGHRRTALPLWHLYGTGVGLATAQLTIVMLSEVPLAQSGEASGLQSTVRQLGSALGVALLGGLLIAKETTALASGVLVLGLLATLALPPVRREDEEGAQGHASH